LWSVCTFSVNKNKIKMRKNKAFLVLATAATIVTGQNSTAEVLVANIDHTVPPNGERVTPVFFDL